MRENGVAFQQVWIASLLVVNFISFFLVLSVYGSGFAHFLIVTYITELIRAALNLGIIYIPGAQLTFMLIMV